MAMADIPLAINIQGDYGFKVVVVDDNDSIATVIKKATDQIIGVLVKPFPLGTVLKAKIHGMSETLPETHTVTQLNLVKMEALDIFVDKSVTH